MAFNWTGGTQSPFSPVRSSTWGSEASRPLFGVGPGSSAFAGTTTGSLFASAPTTSFAPSFSSGSFFSGASPFTAQSSGGFFATAPQTSPSMFATGASQMAQPFAGPLTQWTSWNSQMTPQRVSNPFRDEIYRVVRRRDGRPVTHHTRTDELEEQGLRVIQRIQEEQNAYKEAMAEFMSDPYFERGSNFADLKKEFWREMRNTSEMIPEHQLNVDELQRNLQKTYPRAARIDQTIREAERVLADLGSTVAATRDGQLYVSESVYKHQMEWPHPFIMQMAKELGSRLDGMIRQVTDIEKAPREQQRMREGDEEDLPAFHCVFRLVTLFADKVDDLSKEVALAKERFRAERRRYEDLSDPFAEASRGDRIREAEIHDDWQRDTIRIMQPVITFDHPSGMQATPLFSQSSTGFLGFGQSSGTALFQASSASALFGTSASQGGAMPFGQTTGGGLFSQSSSSTLFGTTASQTGSLFGRTTGTAPFGGSANTSSASFGVFGGGSAATSGSTLFGQSGFGHISSSTGGGFSPGSSVATNLTATPNRYGAKHNHRSL